MNRFVILLISLFILTGCENQLAPDQESHIVYEGIIAEESPAPFLVNNAKILDGQKGSKVKATILETSDHGTVYGHPDYPGTVYVAKGGEKLPEGVWVDNAYGDSFVLHLNKSGSASFGNGKTIDILYAKNLVYEDEDGEIQDVPGPGKLFVRTLSTTGDFDDSVAGKMTASESEGTFVSDDILNIGGTGSN